MKAKRPLLPVAIAALCLMGAVGRARAADPAACTSVRMASPGWTDIDATNAVAGVVLKGLGYQQSIQNVSVPITYQGLRKGQIDAFLGNWMPAQGPMVKPLIAEKAIDVLRPNLPSAKFTLAVPSYVAEQGVKTFADLAKFGDKFDKKIYGIEPGAPANQNIQKMLEGKSFGLDGWKLVESGETAMLTQVDRFVREKKFVVFLAWEPHLMNTKYQLSYLAGGDDYFGPNYGAASVNTVVRPGYAAACPNLGRFFNQLVFNVDMENSIITDMMTDKTPAAAAATKVIKAHPEVLSSWLAGVTTADGGDGLAAVRKSLGL